MADSAKKKDESIKTIEDQNGPEEVDELTSEPKFSGQSPEPKSVGSKKAATNQKSQQKKTKTGGSHA